MDGKQVVDNGGLHPMEEKSGEMELKAGEHELKVEFFENEVDAGCKFSWQPPGKEKEIVPATALSIRYGNPDNFISSFNKSGKMPGEFRSTPREIQNYLAAYPARCWTALICTSKVPPVKFREISSQRANGELSAQIRERVIAARKRQQERFRTSRASPATPAWAAAS